MVTPHTTSTRRLRTLLPPLVVLIVLGAVYIWRAKLVAALPPDDASSVGSMIGYALQIGLWLAGASLFNRFLRVFFWEKVVQRAIGGPVPQLLVSLVSLLIYVLAITVIVGVVFNAPLTGFWTTSGVVGLILGLALRNTIADLFTGIAINIDRPYRIGDWVQVHEQRPEQNVIGEVIEMNWRTTRVRTEENNLVVVPNSVVGQMVVTNFYTPDEVTRDEILFCIDYSVPPDRARRVLLAGAMAATENAGFVADHAPEVLVDRTTELGVEYKVRYWMTPWRGTSPSRARDTVATSVLAHLARAGLALAYPKEDVYFAPMPERHLDSASTDDRQALLARVDLFQPLTDDELASLAERMERRTWSAGEVVIREGDTGHSMLCVVEGLLEAFTEEDGRRCRLGSIGPGEFIGEMSVLTGEPRSATVVSATDGVAYEIGKEPFRSLLTARPELAELISRIIAERRVRDQRAIEALAADEPTTSTKTLAGQILGRIRSFFGHR